MKNSTLVNANAIETLFREHYEGLSRYAFSILKDQEEAEDVVQKLFVKLWEKRNDLEIWKDIKSYLYRSTYNASLNEIKRIKRHTLYETSDKENAFQSDHDASSKVMNEELEKHIESAIQSLPTKCGEVFRLSRFKEYSYKEIAEKLDISVKTVENHMGKALKLMREELEEYLPAIIITILLIKGW